ncbi:hypothetical protein NPIL_156851 [Nephila pilipes]|uniref:Uncharacterized protein n=1 Tax=Nephila pilipes TaxID=299642 RepID=A0A8X6TKL7_NEPPI|nr:hypothetical protein NPIL_156851 [Nephila pilipes]
MYWGEIASSGVPLQWMTHSALKLKSTAFTCSGLQGCSKEDSAQNKIIQSGSSDQYIRYQKRWQRCCSDRKSSHKGLMISFPERQAAYRWSKQLLVRGTYTVFDKGSSNPPERRLENYLSSAFCLVALDRLPSGTLLAVLAWLNTTGVVRPACTRLK